MTDVQMTTTTVAELPKQERTDRGGKYKDLLTVAAKDREPRRGDFPETVTLENVETFRRNLSHAANAMGYGMTGVIKWVDADGAVVGNGKSEQPEGAHLALFWQVRDKRAKVDASGQSTPDAGAGETGASVPGTSTPTASKGKGKG